MQFIGVHTFGKGLSLSCLKGGPGGPSPRSCTMHHVCEPLKGLCGSMVYREALILTHIADTPRPAAASSSWAALMSGKSDAHAPRSGLRESKEYDVLPSGGHLRAIPWAFRRLSA